MRFVSIYCKAWLLYSAGIFEKSMGARNRVGIGLSVYCPAKLHRLAEWISWSRFLGSLIVLKVGLCVRYIHKVVKK